MRPSKRKSNEDKEGNIDCSALLFQVKYKSIRMEAIAAKNQEEHTHHTELLKYTITQTLVDINDLTEFLVVHCKIILKGVNFIKNQLFLAF